MFLKIKFLGQDYVRTDCEFGTLIYPPWVRRSFMSLFKLGLFTYFTWGGVGPGGPSNPFQLRNKVYFNRFHYFDP